VSASSVATCDVLVSITVATCDVPTMSTTASDVLARSVTASVSQQCGNM
jgi:hypothetical protein